jgi:hypothetical protein
MISLIGNLFEWFADQSLNLGIFLQTLIAKVGYTTLKLFYKNNLEEAERIIEATAVNTELTLLSKASELKDHAVSIGDWTEHHTVALNAIGNALLHECDWEQKDVHTYLKRVVESVPGLTYDEED